MKLINGEHKTLDEVLEEHQGMVIKFAQPYRLKARHLGHEYEDLIQLGMLGLMKAYNIHDDEKGRFSSIAAPYIRGEITNNIRYPVSKGIRFPAHIRELAARIVRNKDEDKPLDYLVDKYKRSEKVMKTVMESFNRSNTLSMDENDDKALILRLGSESDFTDVIVSDFMEKLSERDKEILKLVMEGYSYREIGRMFSVSDSAIGFRLTRKIRKRWEIYEMSELR